MSALLAVASGLLSGLAFPGVGWWPLCFVAEVPFLLALEGKSWRQRVGLGLLAGVTWTLVVEHWVAGTIVAMSGLPWWVAVLLLLVFSVWNAGLWALFALAYAPVRRLTGSRRGWILFVPLIRAVLDSAYPSLFPFHAASPLYKVPVLLQAAEWTGIAGPTWMVVLVSCALVHLFEELRARRIDDQFVVTAVAALWLLASVLGVVRMEQIWSAPDKGRPTVVLVQPNVTLEEKKAIDPHVREAVYERTEAMTRQALGLRPDAIVWPEGGFPFRIELDAPEHPVAAEETQDRHYSRRLYRLALDLGVDLVAGGLRSVKGRVRNGLVHFPRHGAPQPYDKIRLIPFGERVPFGDRYPKLTEIAPGMSHHEPGSRPVQLNVAGLRWTPGICYEASFGEFTRRALQLNEGGDVLLNLTNDIWFGATTEPELHLMVQTHRTIENRVWLIRATNSGISAFVDPSGVIRTRTRVGEQRLLAYEIGVPDIGRSFYRRHGDVFLWGLCLLAVGWALALNRGSALSVLGNFWHRRGVRAPGQGDDAETR